MRLSEERYISLLTDFGFKQELREYEDSLKAYRDIKNSIDTAKEEGREEGRVEGIAKEKLATAKRLLGMGLTQEQVAKGHPIPSEIRERHHLKRTFRHPVQLQRIIAACSQVVERRNQGSVKIEDIGIEIELGMNRHPLDTELTAV